jgi:Co/Zn/Cd efflux system component
MEKPSSRARRMKARRCAQHGFARANDLLGNLAVLLAALGVFGTGTGWPDVIVAALMAILALQGAVTVIMHAMTELRSTGPAILAAAKSR